MQPTQDIILSELEPLQKALLIAVYSSGKERAFCLECLEELERLGETYGLITVAKEACPLKKIDAAFYLGKGKLEELRSLAQEKGADVVIFDEEISPHQQRNLEKLFGKTVIDRTELILEVFAQRAKTREARLQIELAQVKYQFPRLKRLWTHLSRQAGTASSGGGAYLKGEGEKQIEIDRRLLRERLERLEEEITAVRSHRHMQRNARLRSQVPTFAIVGYTNAGKSTLLKALTQADVLVEDKLFATLDTTTRKVILPNRQEALLIDTVGFIRKIPHTLVAAFKSTLEEAVYTDVLIHLIDASHPMALSQAEATESVLKDLQATAQPRITVLNKIDQCVSEEGLERLQALEKRYPDAIQMAVIEGKGLDLLQEKMVEYLSSLRRVLHLRIPQSNYQLVSELLREGTVRSSKYQENDVLLDVEVPKNLEHKVLPFVRKEE